MDGLRLGGADCSSRFGGRGWRDWRFWRGFGGGWFRSSEVSDSGSKYSGLRERRGLGGSSSLYWGMLGLRTPAVLGGGGDSAAMYWTTGDVSGAVWECYGIFCMRVIVIFSRLLDSSSCKLQTFGEREKKEARHEMIRGVRTCTIHPISQARPEPGILTFTRHLFHAW